ncbi:hypothetical protein B2G69_00375 [Methylorubrum zatmanii]|nr:hypothetical protein B2G69_00375 [Methylorubrum zatmanii]KQQ09560.1 hypothetical protein ASF59_23035 [Methylobacterium sp. Leaf121]
MIRPPFWQQLGQLRVRNCNLLRRRTCAKQLHAIADEIVHASLIQRTLDLYAYQIALLPSVVQRCIDVRLVGGKRSADLACDGIGVKRGCSCL